MRGQKILGLGKDKRDHFSRLPDSCIHHILSLLPSQASCRTCVLSKSWNHLFSTFPRLEIFQIYICYIRKNSLSACGDSQSQKEEFLNLIDGYLHRRLQSQPSNSNIQKLTLSIQFPDLHLLAPLMDYWLVIAVQRNVAELNLDVIYDHEGYTIWYSVPQSILVSTSLTHLSLSLCALEGKFDAKLPNLRKLQFYRVRISDEQSFHDFLASCPLIECLKLSGVHGLNSIRLFPSLTQLKHAQLHYCELINSFSIEAPNLHTLIIRRTSSPCVFNWPVCCKTLRVMELNGIPITSEQFQILLSILPAIKELEIFDSEGLEIFKISSNHLRSLVLRMCNDLLAPEIFAPNLLTYDFLFHSYYCQGIIFGWYKFKDSLKKSGLCEDLKVVIHDCSKHTVILETVSNISCSSLCYLKGDSDNILCMSSKSYTVLVEEFLAHSPETLSVVCSSHKTIEMISKKIAGFRKVHPVGFWQQRFDGFEIVTSQEAEEMFKPEWNSFLKLQSIGPYQATTFHLKWKNANVDWI